MKPALELSKLRRKSSHSGFTLLETILVLALFGAIAALILPNIGLTIDSRMAMALRELTGTLRSTYDHAVLTGRIHRLVFNLRSGEYWVEASPMGFTGRPSVQNSEKTSAELRAEDSRARLLEDLEKASGEVRRAAGGNADRSYAVRSILVVQRGVLRQTKWAEVEDMILTRRTLPAGLLFWSVATDGMDKPMLYSERREGENAFVYFYPWGEAIRAQIQLASQAPEGGGLDEKSPRNTIVLDALTGQSSILEGLQEADFLQNN